MKLTAHESGFSPLVILYLGLIRPSLPSTQLVLFGTPERLSSSGNRLSLDRLINLFALSGGSSLTVSLT